MSTRHIPVSNQTVSYGDTELRSGWAGRLVVECDTSGGALTLTLPTVPSAGELLITMIDATNNVTFTLNGDTVTLSNIGDTVELYSNGTNWYNANPLTLIR